MQQSKSTFYLQILNNGCDFYDYIILTPIVDTQQHDVVELWALSSSCEKQWSVICVLWAKCTLSILRDQQQKITVVHVGAACKLDIPVLLTVTLMDRAGPPECNHSHQLLTVEHLLTECNLYADSIAYCYLLTFLPYLPTYLLVYY